MNETAAPTEPWFVPLAADRREGPRLLFFPHAGGGPASLTGLAEALAEVAPEISPWAMSLPGRQGRINEPPRADLMRLLEEVDGQLEPLLEHPCVLFGYCGGALLAYLVARRMNDLGHPPVRLIVCSAPAPDLGLYPRRLHLLPGGEFWAEVLAQGGVPPELAERQELRPLFEPAIRADFALLADYRHEPMAPLSCPVTLLYGESDTGLHLGQLLGWRRQTAAGFTARSLPCSHWPAEEVPELLARTVAEEFGVAEEPRRSDHREG
ncbi:surfactin synthase thioesterase subunit [Streptomyces sp. B4I13]|uniref:thioesterase II family protein n=1 Tax=Streptomyces sp. B4I13 TaxID=3042271 RepID=UPI00278A9F19|nr:thioesterase domain-containing protein [Streptomyces sp. B4I13]MDQ0958591.1 surfactin synthase thioesterase subunit [Streptomyces sp. B4I13]